MKNAARPRLEHLLKRVKKAAASRQRCDKIIFTTDVEKTMVLDGDRRGDARMAEIERNNVFIQQAVLGLTKPQGVMQTALEETQKLLRETQIETTGDCARPTKDSATWGKIPTGASPNWCWPLPSWPSSVRARPNPSSAGAAPEITNSVNTLI